MSIGVDSIYKACGLRRECRGHGNRVSGLSRSRVRGGIAGTPEVQHM